MQFRVLGGHQVESSGGRPIAFLIDDRVAIDAGGLLGGLSMEQQRAIEAVLITHYHYDHVRDLPFLALAALEAGRRVAVYCTDQVKDALQRHLLCPPLWLDVFAGPNPAAPTLLHRPVAPGAAFEVGGYDVLPVDNRHHSVPVVGYQVATPGGRRLLYTGDTGPGIRDTWRLVDPDLLITEVTVPNELADVARQAGHLTPATLEAELVAFRDEKGRLPRVLICHVNQLREDQVVAELDEVARRLQAPIELAREGTLIDL
ncbi:MAG TPA: MBL fold metallo-hydrolase [Chloroflexota bacterium]|jgi:ribonuclease BN (tRNA processing enzyme)|nr:MBL fold metallo-hydrolase [Chloroflexota bacterium]